MSTFQAIFRYCLSNWGFFLPYLRSSGSARCYACASSCYIKRFWDLFWSVHNSQLLGGSNVPRFCSRAPTFLHKLHLVLLRSCKSYFTWPGNNCFWSPYSWHFTVIGLNLFNCSISSFHSTVDPSIISCTCSIYTIGARNDNTRFNSYKNMWFLKVEHLKEARSMKPSIICLLRQFIWWKLESSISFS